MRSQLSFEPHPFIRPPSRSRVYLCPFRGFNETHANFSTTLNNIINTPISTRNKTVTIFSTFIKRDLWIITGSITPSRQLHNFTKNTGKHKFLHYRKLFNKLKRIMKQNYHSLIVNNYRHGIRKKHYRRCASSIGLYRFPE